MEFLLEFFKFFKHKKKIWLLPIVLVIITIGGLLLLVSGTVVAPFIYSLF
jgi:ABC-type transport system involved in cytochrome bd biosynthesis fused ATPase/permease subunit